MPTSRPAERRRRKPKPLKFSDEELIDILQEAAGPRDTLSVSEYTKYAKGRLTPGWAHLAHTRHLLQTLRILAQGGCAGGSFGKRPRCVARPRKFNDMQCIDAVRAAALALGKPPTTAAYEEFSRSLAGAFPSVVDRSQSLWNLATGVDEGRARARDEPRTDAQPRRPIPCAIGSMRIPLCTMTQDQKRDEVDPCQFYALRSRIASTAIGGLDRQVRWARLGSNQRPLPCEGSALPLSYAPGRPIIRRRPICPGH